MFRSGSEASVCVKVVRVGVATAATLGLPPETALRDLGIGPDLLADPTARVSNELVARVWTELPRRVECGVFGLRAAELARAAPFDVLDHAIACCHTLREATQALLRYQRLLHDANDVRLEQMAHGEARLSQGLRLPGTMPEHLSDFIAAQWLLRSAALAGERLRVSRVEVTRPAPDDLSEHRRIFDAPIAFGAERNAVWFAEHDLDLPIARADRALSTILRRHADDLLAALPAESTLRAALHRHLLGTLSEGLPEIRKAASALGVSTRSLQRRLGEEGTSFKDVLDDVRRTLAISYLRDGSRTVSEVAFLVGFSEVSAFSRAFRRWTGKSAVHFRRGPP